MRPNQWLVEDITNRIFQKQAARTSVTIVAMYSLNARKLQSVQASGWYRPRK